MACPKCGYQRNQNDDPLIPMTICPSCQIVYAKYGQNITHAYRQSARDKLVRSKCLDPNNITLNQAILISLVLILFVSFIIPYLKKSAIHLIAPFDSQPKVSFSEIIDNPENVESYKNKLCA